MILAASGGGGGTYEACCHEGTEGVCVDRVSAALGPLFSPSGLEGNSESVLFRPEVTTAAAAAATAASWLFFM